MPLLIMDAEQAVETRKSNALAGWGGRESQNRVEPIARPGFKAPFRLEPGARVFTIGSCFARNVEVELLARGFSLPMRDLFTTEAFAGVDLGVINNFGTPSIYNEIAWAFGEKPFAYEDHILEVANGKFADLHLSPTMRPEPFETVARRRKLIFEATRKLSECAMVVMTLGLVELWYDRVTATYLNVAPRPSLVRSHPDRFELHVLDYGEVDGFLRGAMEVIFRHGADDLRVVLTVSPVPLAATHRDEDVITANMYSKSLLRAAAEAVVVDYDRVAYFPSFESVSLSDRKIAWQDDLVHPTREIVKFNIGRMVAAYTGDLDDPVITNEAEAIEAANRALANSDTAFFERFADWSERSVDFAVLHASLLALFDLPAAMAILRHEAIAGRKATTTLSGLLIKNGQAPDAVALLDPLCVPKLKDAPLWTAFVNACAAAGDVQMLRAAAARFARAMPQRHVTVALTLARGLRELAQPALALAALDEAVRLAGPENASIALERASLMIDLGRFADVKAVLDDMAPETDMQESLRMNLLHESGR